MDEDIIFDGKTIPKGCNVNLMIFHLNKDPNYFKDPEAFIPERFSDDNERHENAFVYVPFSAGPRNCIGAFDLPFNYFLINFSNFRSKVCHARTEERDL